MDKDLLRIVIIAIGGTVLIGIILWSIFKNKKPRRGIDFYDRGNPLENIDESLFLNTQHDEFDIVPLGSALDDEPIIELDSVEPVSNTSEQEQEDKVDLPKIIQFSIVASADKGFNGLDLVEAFERVGLEYGSMKIFERIDEQRRVDFAVASMVEPGTFPETDLELFSSPGIVFFIQPGELDNPLQTFDEFVQTINMLATELDGVIWDHNRQPLSDVTIQQFRESLS
jgi:cell division protein ZipA